MNFKEQRDDAIKRARAIKAAADAAHRDMTADEIKSVDALLTEAEDFAEKSKNAAAAKAVMERLSGNGGGNVEPGTDGAKGYWPTSPTGRRATAAALMKASAGVDGVKAPVASGSVIAAVPFDPDIHTLGQPGTSFLGAIRTITRPAVYRYGQQTVRTLNAAVVPAGEEKPVSVFTTQSVENRLEVIATLTEPVDKFLLSDSTGLQQFLANEAVYAVQVAAERKVLGDLLATSGVASQPFDQDAVVSLRDAQTSLAVEGYAASLIVMNPTDWGRMTSRRLTQTGAFDTSAIDAQAVRVWGLPVVLTNAATVGEAVLLDQNAVAFGSDGVVAVEWDSSGDLFSRNETRARVETRMSIDVYQPGAVRTVALASAN